MVKGECTMLHFFAEKTFRRRNLIEVHKRKRKGHEMFTHCLPVIQTSSLDTLLSNLLSFIFTRFSFENVSAFFVGVNNMRSFPNLIFIESHTKLSTALNVEAKKGPPVLSRMRNTVKRLLNWSNSSFQTIFIL